MTSVRLSLNGGLIVWDGSASEFLDSDGELSLSKLEEILKTAMNGKAPNSVYMEVFLADENGRYLHNPRQYFADIEWTGKEMGSFYLR